MVDVITLQKSRSLNKLELAHFEYVEIHCKLKL